MKKPPYLKAQINQGVADLEKRVHPQPLRDKYFERIQIETLFYGKKNKNQQLKKRRQHKYEIKVMTPKIGLKLVTSPPQSTIVRDIGPRDYYRVTFNKYAFTFDSLDKMLLWLYRRIQTTHIYDKKLASTLEGIVDHIERLHEVYRYD